MNKRMTDTPQPSVEDLVEDLVEDSGYNLRSTKRRRRDTIVEKNTSISRGTFVCSDEATYLEKGIRVLPNDQVNRGTFSRNPPYPLRFGTILYPDDSVATGKFVDNNLRSGTFINEVGRITSGTFADNPDKEGNVRLTQGFSAWANGNFEIGTFSTTGRIGHQSFQEGLFLIKKEDGYVLQIGSFQDGQCHGTTLDLRPYMKLSHSNSKE